MSRTKRKRKAKQKLKIIRKRKAGKLVRFVLTVVKRFFKISAEDLFGKFVQR